MKEKFYEIKNIVTGENAQIIAKGYKAACETLGWKPKHCRCIWHADPKNAGDSTKY